MIAVLAEHESDARSICAIVRRLRTGASVRLKPKGYGGCGPLLNKGARDIRNLARSGYQQFLICHDADAISPADVVNRIRHRVVDPSGQGCVCVVVPVEEIEAWMIADEAAIESAIPTCRLPAQANPEAIHRPKEWLSRKSRDARSRPLYVPMIHNPKVAEHIRFEVVESKCPSFRAFTDCLRKQGIV